MNRSGFASQSRRLANLKSLDLRQKSQVQVSPEQRVPNCQWANLLAERYV